MLDAKVMDFWRWAFSDLRDNIVRGALAEFIVASAVGAVESRRKSWGNYDLETPDGVRVEVKASAYWQSWPQRGPSDIKFSGLIGRAWLKNLTWSKKRKVRCDVFVFAHHACREREEYKPLDIDQWDFYVVPAKVIRRADLRSLGLQYLRDLGVESVKCPELPDAIAAAAPRGRRKPADGKTPDHNI